MRMISQIKSAATTTTIDSIFISEEKKLMQYEERAELPT